VKVCASCFFLSFLLTIYNLLSIFLHSLRIKIYIIDAVCRPNDDNDKRPAVGGQCVFRRRARQYQPTSSDAAVDLVVQRVAATHLHHVQPAAVAKTRQLAVQSFDLALLVPLVRYEQLRTRCRLLLLDNTNR